MVLVFTLTSSIPKSYFKKVFELYFIYTFFQSNTLEVLYYRIKLSKRITIISFILILLKHLIHVSDLSTNEHIQNIASAFGACISNT